MKLNRTLTEKENLFYKRIMLEFYFLDTILAAGTLWKDKDEGRSDHYLNVCRRLPIW